VGVSRDISHGEHLEKELDLLVTRRNDQRREAEGHRPSEEMYEESCRRHAEQRREANHAAWAAYHRGQAARHRATLEALIGHHQAEAQKYRENNRHHEEDSCGSTRTRM